MYHRKEPLKDNMRRDLRALVSTVTILKRKGFLYPKMEASVPEVACTIIRHQIRKKNEKRKTKNIKTKKKGRQSSSSVSNYPTAKATQIFDAQKIIPY